LSREGKARGILRSLGDNIIENDIVEAREKFERQERCAHILLKGAPDPERFGVPIQEDLLVAADGQGAQVAR
jgi:dTDP-glucose pyrophosphorylase